MKKFLIIIGFIFVTAILCAQKVHPTLKIEAAGAITDFFIENSSVVLSTDAGTVETYNITTGKQENIIQFPTMKDFMGDDVPTKIYSIDKNLEKLLVVTQGNHGFRNVLIIENGQTQEIFIADRDKLMIKKARWISDNKILLGLMSNDLILFDVGQNKVICDLNISPYTFSDFSLTDKNKFVFTSDESGIVHEIEVCNCLKTQDYTDINVDNIYQLVYKNGVVITAGQDRRVGVYNTITGDDYFLQKDFLVYSVGLSPDGSIGTYSATENSDISIFNTTSRKETHVLSGHESVVTKMVFFDNGIFISAGDDKYLLIWKID